MTLLALLLSLPVFHAEPAPETAEERANRLAVVAQVIEEVAATRPGGLPPLTAKAVMVSIAIHESHLAAYVGTGHCQDGPVGARCDRGLARTYWQLHRNACRAAWAEREGSEAELRAAARCAAVLWAGARGRCRGRHPAGDEAGAFSGYRSVYCSWGGARGRQRTLWWVRQKLGGES